jgi:hypothetical protein
MASEQPFVAKYNIVECLIRAVTADRCLNLGALLQYFSAAQHRKPVLLFRVDSLRLAANTGGCKLNACYRPWDFTPTEIVAVP